jgi:hypothetical protein
MRQTCKQWIKISMRGCIVQARMTMNRPNNETSHCFAYLKLEFVSYASGPMGPRWARRVKQEPV